MTYTRTDDIVVSSTNQKSLTSLPNRLYICARYTFILFICIIYNNIRVRSIFNFFFFYLSVYGTSFCATTANQCVYKCRQCIQTVHTSQLSHRVFIGPLTIIIFVRDSKNYYYYCAPFTRLLFLFFYLIKLSC